MPAPVTEAAAECAHCARLKVEALARPARYALSSAAAGVYVGLAVVLLLAVTGPLVAAGAAASRLVQGGVFGLALTLVVFAGAELATGNVMYLTQGVVAGVVRWRRACCVMAASLAGNALGSLTVASAVHAGGTIGPSSPAAELLVSMITLKGVADGGQLFWRAVLCNALVCLALWMAVRAQEDGPRLAVLWWGLFAFVASGFEHSVANMTLYSLGVLAGEASWLDLGRNLVWTVPGNLVGGALVGAAYAWLAQPASPSLASSFAGLPAPAARAVEAVEP